MSRNVWRSAGAFIALAAAACTSQSPSAGGSAASSEIAIGEVGSMTGSEATFGLSTHKGFQLAIDQLNAAGGVRGRKLKLYTVDDQGRASEAALAVTQLISQHQVVAILGEVSSGKSLAMAPLAQQSKVPMITPSSINSRVTQTGDYIFRVCFTDRFQSRAMSDFASLNLKAKKAAILRDSTSDYSVDSAKYFIEDFQKAGGQIVADVSYSSGDINFKSQLTAIKAKTPDVILVPGYYTDVGLIARQAHELGLTTPLLGGDGWDSPKLTEIGGPALDGSYFVTHFSRDDNSPAVQTFLTSYEVANAGEAPDGLAALGYDAAKVLGAALSRVADPITPQALRNQIAATREFAGVTGTITINAERNAVKPAVVLKVDGVHLKQMAKISP